MPDLPLLALIRENKTYFYILLYLVWRWSAASIELRDGFITESH